MNKSRRGFLKSLALAPIGGAAAVAGIGESVAHTDKFDALVEAWWTEGRAAVNKRETRRDRVMALWRTGASVRQIADETGKIVQAEAFPLRAVYQLLDSAFASIAKHADIEALEREEANMVARLHDAAAALDIAT